MKGFPVSVDLGLLISRLMLAAVGIFHGAQKLFGIWGGHGIRGTAGFMEGLGMPLPTIAAIAAGGAELIGGLLLAVGLYSRIGNIFWAFTMYVATFAVHARNGFDITKGGMEFALTMAVILTAFIISGPGRYAFTPRL